MLTLAINLVFRNCIECLGFDLGPFKKNCSVACSESVYHQMVDQFTFSSKECQQKDTESCWIKFKLDQLVGEDTYQAEILKQRGKLQMKFFTFKNNLIVSVQFSVVPQFGNMNKSPQPC